MPGRVGETARGGLCSLSSQADASAAQATYVCHSVASSAQRSALLK
jgi:uncharacterized protein YdbL (DUF1318 family)